jgi:hypothetical protein
MVVALAVVFLASGGFAVTNHNAGVEARAALDRREDLGATTARHRQQLRSPP